MKRVLIVGAGGFIGGFIAAESLRRGYDTWCALRESTSRRYLTDPRLKFVVLDYHDASQMRQALKDALPDGEKWDWIVYNLGATKVTNYADFNRINCDYLRSFLLALDSGELMPERFLYMSSLSALGPCDERKYTPYHSGMIPFPNTRYGVSKVKAETLIEMTPALNWIIFRPTGVYGPNEQDYLMMIKSIDRHIDFSVGFRKQLLTYIYVEDLASAIFDALERGQLRKKYIISEGRAYTARESTRVIADALGGRFTIPVRLPLWMAKVVCIAAEKWGLLRLKPSTLNSDKYKIMRQRNWSADISDARQDFGFNPRHSLAEGMKKTVEAYRSNGKQ